MGNAPLAAVLVARLADYAVCLGMVALAWHELRGDWTSARRALAITLSFPLAFFLGAAYTESLFLAEVCFTLLFARRHAWGLAATFGFLAAVTHPRGIVLFLPLAWEWAITMRPWVAWREWRVWRSGALALLSVPVGFLLVAAIDAIASGGDLLAIVHTHASFDRVSLAPWNILHLALGILVRSPTGTINQAHNLFDIGLVLFVSVIVAVAACRRQMPGAFVLYSVGLIVLSIASPTPHQSDPFLSAGRFIIPSVPAFLVLSSWAKNRPWLQWLVVGGGLCLEVTLAAFYINGGWLI